MQRYGPFKYVYEMDTSVECSLWSLKIPSMEGDFVGMSLYFFVVDFVKSIYQLGDQEHPSIDDLKSFGRSFCAMNWT